MSDYHILSADEHGNSFNVIMHFPVPDNLNEISRNYREVLIEWLGGSQPSQVPFIDGAEQTQLNAGELLEHSVRFNSTPNETLAERRVRLEAIYADKRPKILGELQNKLAYWGYNGDVP